MTDLTPYVKSHPSVRVRRLLASAELDAPSLGAKERALVALSQAHRHAQTTNFSGVALGNTVSRLLGAVTIYGSAASPWRLLARGSVIGAAAGGLALATIVMVRWIDAPSARGDAAAAAQPPTAVEMQPAISTVEARQEALLRGAALELDAGRPAAALESIETLLRFKPGPKTLPQITLLKTKALLHLGRFEDAKATAAPLLAGPPCPEATEMRALLEAHVQPAPRSSAK